MKGSVDSKIVQCVCMFWGGGGGGGGAGYLWSLTGQLGWVGGHRQRLTTVHHHLHGRCPRVNICRGQSRVGESDLTPPIHFQCSNRVCS